MEDTSQSHQTSFSQMMGTWYEYMYRTPGLDDFNTVNVLSSIGVTSVSGLSTPVIAVNWTVSFLVKLFDIVDLLQDYS